MADEELSFNTVLTKDQADKISKLLDKSEGQKQGTMTTTRTFIPHSVINRMGKVVSRGNLL